MTTPLCVLLIVLSVLALATGAALVGLVCSCALLGQALWQSGPPSGGGREVVR